MAENEIERRLTVSDTSIEYREVGNGEKRPVIVGYAAVFNSESRNLGGFVETIHPNAFDEVLATNPDVIGVYNHSKDKLLARSANGTLKLRPDAYGLRYEMGPLPKTQTAEEVVELVAGGYVTGSSFAFAIKNANGVRGENWSVTNDGLRKREVRSIGKLEDVGPVVRPAFEASSVIVSRRAIEMALGDAYRPNQTMANAARKGLNACRGRDDVDGVLMGIAEHLVAREIVSVEEVEYLANVHGRCVEARAEDWVGSPAWVEWKLAGGEAGAKWVAKRRASAASSPEALRSEPIATRAEPGELKEGDFVSWDGGYGRVEHVMREGAIQGMTATPDAPLAVVTPFDDGEPEDYMVAVMVSELTKSDGDEERAAGDKSQSTPAPKGDQITGSDKNRPGSAKSAGGRIKVSQAVRAGLQNKVRDHNEAMREDEKPTWSRTTVGQLLAVYRRGSGAYSTSHRPGVSRGAWAMARVNAYLYLLRNGRPRDAKYVTDNDLLPGGHPKASDERTFVEEFEQRAAVSLKPTAGMAAAARRGLRLHEEGKSGDGLKPETVARANKLAAREEMNEDWVREMNAWFARHESASKSPGWDTPGAEKPGFVAWLLWGGNAAQRFAAAKVAQMDRQDQRSMEDALPPAKRAVAKALEDIADIHGQFAPAAVNYMAQSQFESMRCANCVFYEGGGGCEIVQGSVSPEGLCQFHVIPEATMNESESRDAAVQEPQAPAPEAVPAETNSAAVEAAPTPDPVEQLLVKAAELKATVLRTRLQTM
jgi:HK97 family phage prohead protease